MFNLFFDFFRQTQNSIISKFFLMLLKIQKFVEIAKLHIIIHIIVC